MTPGPIGPGQLTQHIITVLLIDDQPMIGEAVRRMLDTEKDVAFHFLSDPGKALSFALEISPTVILLDLIMPEIDGLTLVKFMRANARLKNVPIIVLSSKEEAVTKAQAFALGVNDYLVKLPDKIELIARIRYHSMAYINLLQRNEAYRALFESQQALKKELDRAAQYVISLLPKPLKEKGLSTNWRFIPSSSLGGDAFGYHWLDDENFSMYLLDVCGHGVGSALLSVSAMNALKTQALPATDFGRPDQVLMALNKAFPMEEHNDLYFSIWYGVYNIGTRKLTYASGGHPPALLMEGAADQIRGLATENLLIGAIPNVPFKSGECTLSVPARLYLYSDGVYEIKKSSDGEMWELKEFMAFMNDQRPREKNAIERLIHHAQTLQGSESFEDDFCMVEIAISM